MQLTFQKYEVGYVFKVNYSGRGIVPYMITRIIPLEERQQYAKEGREIIFQRHYKTEPIMGNFFYQFIMSEDEMDSHEPFPDDELKEWKDGFVANIALNRLLDKGEIYD